MNTLISVKHTNLNQLGKLYSFENKEVFIYFLAIFILIFICIIGPVIFFIFAAILLRNNLIYPLKYLKSNMV
jgi:hypothetical protein